MENLAVISDAQISQTLSKEFHKSNFPS